MQIGGNILPLQCPGLIRPSASNEGKGRIVLADDPYLLLPQLGRYKPQDTNSPGKLAEASLRLIQESLCLRRAHHTQREEGQRSALSYTKSEFDSIADTSHRPLNDGISRAMGAS